MANLREAIHASPVHGAKSLPDGDGWYLTVWRVGDVGHISHRVFQWNANDQLIEDQWYHDPERLVVDLAGRWGNPSDATNWLSVLETD